MHCEEIKNSIKAKIGTRHCLESHLLLQKSMATGGHPRLVALQSRCVLAVWGVTVESMTGTNAVRDPQTVALNAWGRYASGERLHGSAEHINLSRSGGIAF